MKIALYQHALGSSGPLIFKATKYMENDSDFMRVSEIMEVDFKELAKPPKAMVAEMKVAAAQKVFDEAKAKLEKLQDES